MIGMGRFTSIAVFCLFPAGSLWAADHQRLSTKYLFVQPNASAAPIIRAGADRVPDQYIVGLRDDILPDEIAGIARTIGAVNGLEPEKVWSNAVKAMFVRMTESQAQLVARDPFVKYVEENARWQLSVSQQTSIDPRTCDPVTGSGCASVVDNRLWHLDRLDQNYATPNSTYSYCTDGTGVTIYVVDTGVNKLHNEFGPSGARVLTGYNATGDQMPANDPCLGFAVPPSGFYSRGIRESSGMKTEC